MINFFGVRTTDNSWLILEENPGWTPEHRKESVKELLEVSLESQKKSFSKRRNRISGVTPWGNHNGTTWGVPEEGSEIIT